MKIHWVVPLTADAAFQFTDKNELARSLKALGHEITTIVAYRQERKEMDGFSRVQYVRVPRRSALRKMIFHWCILRSIWSSRADVVMLGHSAAHLIPLAWLGFMAGRRPAFVLDIRTVPVDVKGNLRGKLDLLRYRLAVKVADRFCDGITVITPMLGESILPDLKRLSGRLGVWTSGVNLQQFQRQGPSMKEALGLSGNKILLYHGILSPNRGLQNAILAVGLLRGVLPELIFLVVGDGEARVELAELAARHGVGKRVVFTGKVPYEDIPAYIRAADIGILPFPNIRWWDVSSPLKLMEYLAVGINVVATDIRAHRVVAEQTGGVMLVADNQPRVLAQGILDALNGGPQAPSRELLEKTISYNSQARNVAEFFSGLRGVRVPRPAGNPAGRT